MVSREYLCDYPSCVNLNFDQYDQINNHLVINMSDQDFRSLDSKEDQEQKLFESVPSFGSLRTTNVFSPLHLIKIIEKRFTEEDIFIEKRLFQKWRVVFKRAVSTFDSIP